MNTKKTGKPSADAGEMITALDQLSGLHTGADRTMVDVKIFSVGQEFPTLAASDRKENCPDTTSERL